MTQPAVTITQLDGTLGIPSVTAGSLFAVVGPSSTGTVATPATFGRVKDITATFGVGPMVEAACHYVERYGRPVICVNTGTTTAGSSGTVTTTGGGTSVVTADVPTTPLDDYEVYFLVVAGGTVGTAGITFQWSLDGGRTLSPVTSLGTANSYTITGAGVKLNFAAGTMLAGQLTTYTTTAPIGNATQIGAALDALKNSVLVWELCEIVGPVDGTSFPVIDGKFAAMVSAGTPHAFICHARNPTSVETEAAYKTAIDTIFTSLSSLYGELCVGACQMYSSVSQRIYTRPASFIIAAREAYVSPEINIASPLLGPLPCSIRDANGNPRNHDESVNPGLDDSRYSVLRTIPGLTGVYANRPRIFSPAGSDFSIMPYRRVINIAQSVLQTYFTLRLNMPIRVDAVTGYIFEADALEIEAGARAALSAQLLTKPMVSAIAVTLSRTDNILSTKTINAQARVTPLGYPEFINLDLGFVNPALQVRPVA